MDTQQEACGQNILDQEEYAMAIRALNRAAHYAIQAGANTTALPSIDRRSLRLIACETDRLVDYEKNSGEYDSGIRANTNDKDTLA